MKCFICGLNLKKFSSNYYIKSNKYNIHKCKACHTGFTIPKLSKKNLNKLYSNNIYRNTKGERFKSIFQKIFDYFNLLKAYKLNLLLNKQSNILDVGCGDGKILSFLKQKGHNVIGTEYKIKKNSILVNNKKIPIYSNKKALHKKNKYDLIILAHVLPHLHDVNKIINKIKISLKNTGLVYISMPNFSSTQSKLSKSNWFHLDIPRHIYHFSDKTFIKYMHKKKFSLKKKVRSEYHHIFFGWLQSLLNIFLNEKNLLFNYLSIFKKRINLYKFIKLFLLTFLLIPFSLILTFLEIVQLMKPSIIVYYFSKRVS